MMDWRLQTAGSMCRVDRFDFSAPQRDLKSDEGKYLRSANGFCKFPLDVRRRF
jgi:hypothetical protein